MKSLFRLCPAGAALLVACSIGLDQGESNDGQAEECLELFETCVELAGESPGCTEVFEFCEGTPASAPTGGPAPAGGCEQDYIDCLVEGATAETCQPLLDACTPPAGSTTGCDPLEPGCGDVDDLGTTTGEPGCGKEGGPPCGPTPAECEAQYASCESVLGEGEGEICDALRTACEDGDCETAISLCTRVLGSDELCEEVTGCTDTTQPPRPPTCDELLSMCADKGLSPSQCEEIYPDNPDCFPDEPSECPWYEQECSASFDPAFCADGQLACETGWLPTVFECDAFLPDACGPAGVKGSACDLVLESCYGGFVDALNCSATPLYENPYTWLAELVECNEWG